MLSLSSTLCGGSAFVIRLAAVESNLRQGLDIIISSTELVFLIYVTWLLDYIGNVCASLLALVHTIFYLSYE